MDFATRYATLNPAQKQAVDTVDGPVMVIAGPGTGKTELLGMRVASILKHTDTLPENILCLTFTESGASAMRQRLTDIIGKDAYKVAVHTFHSFGSEVINQNADFFYQGAHFRPASDLNSYELLRGIFDELDYSNPLSVKMNGQYTHLNDTLGTISELKKSGLTSDELLSVLDSNDEVIDASEKILAPIFADKISKATIERLADCVIPLRSAGGEVNLPGIASLSSVIADSLHHGVIEAEDTQSTKPITAWRNQWMKKNDKGEFVLKSRDRQTKLRAVSFVYYQYLTRMQENELYDFDDMILRVVHAMEVFPELLLNLQETYQYILVDEFQDTNLAQMRILHNLTDNPIHAGRPNIMVVGDDDQAIYSFQGAEISNILTFTDQYKDVRTITLTDNYRSSAPILQAAREVIVQNNTRLETTLGAIDKQLTARASTTNTAVTLAVADSIEAERNYIVASAKKIISTGKGQTIAVLARRHHELVSLLPYFSGAGIQINYERRDDVLEVEPIKLLEKTATIIQALYLGDHDDVEALLPEVLSHPAWGFSPKDIWRLSLDSYSSRTTWMERMSVTPQFVPLYTWLVTLARQVSTTPLEQLLDQIIGKGEQTAEQQQADLMVSPLYNYFFSDDRLAEAPDQYLVYLEALRTIRSKLREYQPDTIPYLASFLEYIRLHRELGSSITSIRPATDTDSNAAVTLMTAHKSKGLEFDHVFVIGAVDSSWGERVRSRSRLIGYPENLPLAPSGDSLDERLRLFFVAMTRARTHLTISYSLHDDNGKDTLGANFLLGTSLSAQELTTGSSTKDRVTNAERAWYEPLTPHSNANLKSLLAPILEKYLLSATSLNNFIDISRGGPQLFLLNNLLRFPQAMSANAAYGSAIHATLQRAHAHVSATKKQRPIEDILHDFEQNLAQRHMTQGDYDMFLQRGSDTLQTFLSQKYDSFTTDQKVELSFASQHVIVGSAHLTGSLDLVDLDPLEKTIRITDYKTGKPSASWQGKTDSEKIKLHKYRQQLMFYQLLVEHSRDYHGYQVTNGVLQFVEPTSSGEIVALEATFTRDELATFARLVEVVWNKIITLDLPDTSHYDPTYKGILAFEQDLLSDV